MILFSRKPEHGPVYHAILSESMLYTGLKILNPGILDPGSKILDPYLWWLIGSLEENILNVGYVYFDLCGTQEALGGCKIPLQGVGTIWGDFRCVFDLCVLL